MKQTNSIAVGSLNPVKIQAALRGFELMFPESQFNAAGYEVPSLVSNQPATGEETRRGANNRAKGTQELSPNSDFVVGIEGGIETIEQTMFASAWICVIDQQGHVAESRSGTFPLPPKVQSLVESGVELGLANDRVFSEHNSKHAGGAVGSLTGGIVSRTQLYVHAIALALAVFKKTELFRV